MWGDVWNPRFWGIRNGFTPGTDNIILLFFFFLSSYQKMKKQKTKENKKIQIINFFDLLNSATSKNFDVALFKTSKKIYFFFFSSYQNFF
jgi:hypothetical protein